MRRTTSTCSIDATPATASSACGLVATAVPRRFCPSLVMRSFAPVSSTRNRRASAEKPPKTSECTAPMRATARVATIVSTSTGR
ncbi:hypothetical protein BC477_12970 [Clavibacter michiganensis subsp. michiganensis]|uniref:Uncharacterized protein n=1 Tax=Clavibacter michiganensis subsp. michiganensis TaxID=33013 RepID=A0A251XHR4_CLAMM|nr:hypothetical protein BC477_12970 [Clavibacter michiganensis subsp. michiganensis]OUE02707.1 hypothetical protein CMMCAS07_11875 [Clavibacter michiganensis subsp. michiganensis]